MGELLSEMVSEPGANLFCICDRRFYECRVIHWMVRPGLAAVGARSLLTICIVATTVSTAGTAPRGVDERPERAAGICAERGGDVRTKLRFTW